MKIEKIKNYNQKLLAVLGTIGVLFLTIALLAFITFSILDFNDYREEPFETGILSDEKIEELQKENKREQVISYQTPKLIDTLNQIYIIPISHKSLNEQEEINGKTLKLITSSNDYNYETDQRYSTRYYGDFNNIIVYDQKTENTKKLFDKRVNFDDIKTEYFSDDVLLLFKVAEKDTYKDGVINLLDYKSLYIYSINEKKLKKIVSTGLDVHSYKFLNNSKDLVIRFGIDKNSNGKHEGYNEPTILKKYNFQTETLTDIIDKKTSSQLQKMLEGTKKEIK
ncbi:MAG: hypothetical protein ACI9OT_002135 [Gammaproteobacteria bacterium]|jgi:hypothetical protein